MAAEVLVVEDEPDIRNLIVLHLSREGFRCRTAKSGPGGGGRRRAVRRATARARLGLHARRRYRVADGRRPRAPFARQARRHRPAHRDAQGRGLPVRGRLMLPALLHAIRRSIALKLTLTLIGFVGISLIAAGIYLNQALETFAVEALEARLATSARLLTDA